MDPEKVIQWLASRPAALRLTLAVLLSLALWAVILLVVVALVG